MLTGSDIPAGLSEGVRALFFKSLESAPGNYRKLAMVLPSSQSRETYAWLSSVPGMREFVDERQPFGLREHSFTIENKTWESTIQVERTALEDEQYGQIRLRIQSLAEAAARHKEQLVFELVRDGFEARCYDGQPFFSSAHPSAGGSVSNRGNEELSSSALQSAMARMARLTDERGQPLGILADTLVVPPELEWKALEIVSSPLDPDGTGNAANVLRGRLEVIVSPYLSDSSDWFLFCTRGVLKPLILQERTSVEFRGPDSGAGGEEAFMRDRLLYGVRARYNAGYGLWQLAFGSRVS